MFIMYFFFMLLRRHSSTFKSFEEMVGNVKVSLFTWAGSTQSVLTVFLIIDHLFVWTTQEKVTGSLTNNGDTSGFEQRSSRNNTYQWIVFHTMLSYVRMIFCSLVSVNFFSYFWPLY